MCWKSIICIGALCALAIGANAQTRPVAPVTITVSNSPQALAVPLDFSGLSFERGALNPGNAGVPGYLFSPSDQPLVHLFQTLGVRNLRIGGGSVDDEIPAGTGSDGYKGVDNLFAFAQAAGVKVLYSLRLLDPEKRPVPNLLGDDANAAQYIWEKYRGELASFALGNEPDFHSYHTYPRHLEDPAIYETTPGVSGSAFPSYLSDWKIFVHAILAQVPAARFSGPETGAYNAGTYTPNPASGISWTQALADAAQHTGIFADATQHYYVGGGPGQTTAQQAIGNMLSSDWADATQIGRGPQGFSTYTPYPWLYRHNLRPVLDAGMPFRLTESNEYLGGVRGASNSFASALWTLDYMHWWAENGAAGVNFHNKQWIFTDTIVPSPVPCPAAGCGDFQAAPKGYGIKAFELGGHGYIEPAAIAAADGMNLTAYAIGDAHRLYVTIINKTFGAGALDAQITILPRGFRAASAQAIFLGDAQPGNPALETVTLGGAPITNLTRWLGKWTPLSPETRRKITVVLPASTAAIVKIRAAGKFTGPVRMNQNGRLEIFGINRHGDVLYDLQSAAGEAGSNSDSWSGWNVLGGLAANGSVAAVRNEDNTLQAFVPGANGDIFYNQQALPGGPWHGWIDMGGCSRGLTHLTAARNADGSLRVFGLAGTGDVWTASEHAPGVGWSAWRDLGDIGLVSSLTFGQDLDGRLEVFGVDAEGSVWHIRQTDNGGWSTWTEMPGKRFVPGLAVAGELDGRLELFGLTANGDLWFASQATPGGAWGNWQKLPSTSPQGHARLRPGFVVGQNARGQLELFGVRRGTHEVWSVLQCPDDGWGNWTNLGGFGFNPHLAVGNGADGYLRLFGVSRAGQVWSDRQQSSQEWSGWHDLGGEGIALYLGHDREDSPRLINQPRSSDRR